MGNTPVCGWTFDSDPARNISLLLRFGHEQMIIEFVIKIPISQGLITS